jgi:hypothetical protein
LSYFNNFQCINEETCQLVYQKINILLIRIFSIRYVASFYPLAEEAQLVNID